MLNNLNKAIGYVEQQISVAKEYYGEFRLYNIGSYAINHFVSRKGFSKQIDISYGMHERHQLDLFRTEKPKPKRPLLIFVHGGAWSSGDKKDYHFFGQSFATEGYDVAIVNYRLSPEHIFPNYVDDFILALDYLNKNQNELKINTENMLLVGHSAGAFNIMSAVYYPDDQMAVYSKNIKAIVGLAGPYHFDYKNDPLCADAFDQELSYQRVMPYYFVKSNKIKHYLFMAENDQIVADWNAVDLNRKLTEYNNHSEVIVIPKTGHITIMGSVSSLFSQFFRTKAEILRVLDEALNEV